MKFYDIFFYFAEFIENMKFIIEDFFIESEKVINEYGGIE